MNHRPRFPAAIRTLLGSLLLVLAPACGSNGDKNPPEFPGRWRVHSSPDAPEAVATAARDAADYLSRMGLDAKHEPRKDDVTCSSGVGRVVLVGDGLGGTTLAPDETDDQTWRIDETRCSGGAVVRLEGGGRLGRQYAVYEWLHGLGVRFFHPEQEYVPASPDWPDEPVERRHTPAFEYRSVSLHLTHPLELGDAFESGEKQYFDEARRYIDWQVKNKASFGTEGVGSGDLEDYGLRRGFAESTGFSLLNQQQGGDNVIDPDDPREPTKQIAEAIDSRMGGPSNDDPPEIFSFTFNPSEFTEIDDEKTVRYLTFIADYFERHYPETILLTTNHGTAGEPTDDFGVRFYDLPKFAPSNLGVKVHSLMFYDLFRPAPVYGNDDFNNLYDFMVEEYRDRRIWHFPEAAWWLTFDIAVPLYLPITIEARHRDIQGIAFMLEGKLDGHRVFGTGHEWGYWQNEYCSFRMAADLSYGWRDCIGDIAGVAGDEAAPVVRDALVRVVEYQERDLVYGDILRYLVGTDPQTRLASSVGVQFHPLPPTPSEIMNWDVEQVESWKRRIGPALERMDAQYAALVERLDDVRESVPEKGRPWFDEIRDGIEVTGLRARHARELYGALVAKRESQLRDDMKLAGRADELLAEAKKTTKEAIEVIRRREKGYRYQPLSRSIAGGPEGTKDDNWTTYDYRYLNRTHWGYYYKRVDRMATDVFEGTSGTVQIEDAILGPDEELEVAVSGEKLSDVSMAFGDGDEATGTSATHSYDQPGVYELVVSGDRDGTPFSRKLKVASVAVEDQTGFTGTVEKPEASQVSVIEGALPGLAFGPTAGDRVALGFTTDSSGDVRPDLWKPLDRLSRGGGFKTTPRRMTVPVVDQSTGEVRTSLVVEEAVLHRNSSAATLTGKLSTSAVVDAIVTVGGGAFDRQGARELVASALGYSPDSLPETVPFEVAYDLGGGGGDAGDVDAAEGRDVATDADVELDVEDVAETTDSDAGIPIDASDVAAD